MQRMEVENPNYALTSKVFKCQHIILKIFSSTQQDGLVFKALLISKNNCGNLIIEVNTKAVCLF